jgi:hypothetical protein
MAFFINMQTIDPSFYALPAHLFREKVTQNQSLVSSKPPHFPTLHKSIEPDHRKHKKQVQAHLSRFQKQISGRH